MKYKVGDVARVRSKEWIEAQEKDQDGWIPGSDGRYMSPDMFKFAGNVVVISNEYPIQIEGCGWCWAEWMFDPDYYDYNPSDDPLSARDAIMAMMEGAKLYNSEGTAFWFTGDHFAWEMPDGNGGDQVKNFNGLSYKRKRLMTQWEAIDWSNSEASRGWVVISKNEGLWSPPQSFRYNLNIGMYQRARLLPDLSGVDGSTIQGFEVEV
jgi:hypothetical protein